MCVLCYVHRLKIMLLQRYLAITFLGGNLHKTTAPADSFIEKGVCVFEHEHEHEYEQETSVSD